MPTQKDIAVWVGNDSDLIMRWWEDAAKTIPFDFGGSEITFVASWLGGSITRSSTDGGVLLDTPAAGHITIPFSPEDTRRFPAAGPVKYEIARRIGGRTTTLVYGVVKISRWGNSDG